MKFRIKLNELYNNSIDNEYNFKGVGTYCALEAANINSYPDNVLQEILDKYGYVNKNSSLNDAHVTIIFSPDLITEEQYSKVIQELSLIDNSGLLVNVEDVIVFANNNGTHLVAKLEKHPTLLKLNNMFKSFELSETFPDYTPHVTLFTTEDIIPKEDFNDVSIELLSYFRDKPILFSRWTLKNISENIKNF